jgi:Holliday junction resolvasome RuvABC DNA-binding subunit
VGAGSKPGTAGGSDSLSSRLIAALTGLGYRAVEAEKAAGALVPKDGKGELSILLREALKYLAS